jgi:hypothetical protein
MKKKEETKKDAKDIGNPYFDDFFGTKLDQMYAPE